MPCNSDYLKPNQSEIYSRRVAKLLIFVHSKIGNKKWTLPDSVYRVANCTYGNPSMLNEFTRMLCRFCKQMTPEQEQSIIYNARCKESRDLADWWEEHQEADRQRIEKEQAEKKEQFLKAQAMSKLTDEEKEALGL